MQTLFINYCFLLLSPADNIALGQPDYTLAVDGNLQTCHTTASILDPFLRIDLGFVRPVALVHIVSEVNMTDVAVVVGEQYNFLLI